jgi:type I restriction enzyme S subunit
MAKGGNQPNLNGNMIKSFPVLMPPRKLQDDFVVFMDRANNLKFVVQKSIDETQLLFDSLMQTYFS